MEEKICQDLDNAITAMEKLENESKTEMCENLSAARDEQVSKIKEAKLEIEKHAQEPNAKAVELSMVKQMYEDAKSDLHQKELTLEQLRFAHDKLQEDNGIMEGRNNELVSALDEANKKIQSFKDEIECTKAVASISPKNDQNAPAQGDEDLLIELDEENAEIKNQLKCKTEQYNHLHETHEKAQDQFLVNKKEWEEERCMLIEEISSLQAKLDYQTTISESLQHNMQLCNEALAQEESRTKWLEAQISGECGEANSKRDDEIASFKGYHELGSISSHVQLPTKNQETQLELDNCYCSMMQLKLQNEELYIMLTLYKSWVSDAYSTLSQQPKLDMEPDNKEAQVKSVLIEELDQKSTSPTKAHFEFEHEPESLAGKDKFEDEFEHKYLMTLTELENCIDMLEESSMQQLQLKEESLQIENDLKEDLRKVGDAFDNLSSELVEKIQEAIEIELELERWISVAEHLQHCLDVSLKVRREMEVSLLAQVETEHTLKQENEHLLHLVEEKEKRADSLQREMVSLNQELLKSESETATLARMVLQSEPEMEKEKFLQIVQEKNKNINKHRKKLYSMEQEVMRRELDGMRRELENAIFVQVQTEQSLEQERDRLLQVVGKKDGIIEHLWLQIMEHDLVSLIKVSTLAQHDEESENVLVAQFLDELETQVKNTVIMELEAEISGLELTLESNEKTVACTKSQVEQLEAALEAKQLEMETMRSRLGTSSEDNQEKVDLLGVVEKLNNGLCDEDKEKEVMRRLESYATGDQKLTGLKLGAKFYDSDRDNGSETTPDTRSSHLIEVSN